MAYITKFLAQFIAARRVSTSLMAVRTPDMSITAESIKQTPDPTVPRAQADEHIGKFPVVGWDCSRGLFGLNDMGSSALGELGIDPAQALNPADALFACDKLPTKTVLLLYNLHLFLTGEGSKNVIQALWNLRDSFKADFRSAVILGIDIQLSPELAQDVMVLDEALPTIAELESIAKELFKSAGFPEPKQSTLDKITNATCGLAAYPAEQSIAMSLNKDMPEKIDFEMLWDRKVQAINQTRGLKVSNDKVTMSDVVGCENAKEFISGYINGPKSPRAVILMDEGEKMFAGVNDAGSSVGKEQLQTVLTEMEDRGYTGMVMVGPPGAAKTHFSKAIGGSASAVFLKADIGEAKDQYVGNSNAYTRYMFKTIFSVSQGRAFFVMTVNNLQSIPAELLRRFKLGIWYFDLPSDEAVAKAWPIYMKIYNLKKQPLPACKNWTIAEVRNCCEIAEATGSSLIKAATYIVPVCLSDAARIETLRQMANGKFNNAEASGTYLYKTEAQASRTANAARTVNVG